MVTGASGPPVGSSSPEQAARSAEALRRVWDHARAATAARIGVIEDAAVAAMEQRLDEEGRAEAEHVAHQIAGSAGSFGFTAAAEVARRVELLLAGGVPSATGSILELTQLVAELGSAFAAADRHEPATPGDVPAVASPGRPSDTRRATPGALPPAPDEGAISDALTGLGDREAATAQLEQLLEVADQHGEPVVLALVEVDGLADVNERFGFDEGDAIMRRLAGKLARTFRSADVVGRWGGARFVVGAYGARPHFLVPRLGAVIEEARSGSPAGPSEAEVAFNAGVSAIPGDADSFEDLYAAAAGALRRARAAGGNRVVTTAPAASPTTTDVVVVEDDELLAGLLTHAMEAAGLRCLQIGDGEEAVALLGGPDPAVQARVVLLDVDLPGLNGLDVLRHVARSGGLAEAKVIMLTAHVVEREVLDALEAGAFDHVAKPFSVPVLLARVQRALRS